MSVELKRKKLSILIVQMGAPEEIYRSLMALKAVKHLYPELQVQVAVRKECSESVKRVDWIDEVIETPRFEAGSDPVVEVAQWINKIINQNYDLLVNWTFSKKHSKMAAIITSLIPALIKAGNYLRDDGSISSFDAWSMYREAWTRNEAIEQDIHHTDIITTQLLTLLQIHAGDPAPESGVTAVTSKFFFKNSIIDLPETWANRPKGLKWVAVHLDSLSERASEWVEMVLRRNPDYGVVLMGRVVPEEIQSSERVIQLESTLRFDAQVQVLSNCYWLIAGESPIVDLASLLNVRIFYSPRASVREFSLKWAENGPYGNGHVIMNSAMAWKPELAYATWSYFQSEWFHKNSLTLNGHFENLELKDGLAEIQVLKSRIRPPQEGGGVCYDRVAGVAQDFEAWMYRVRGQMARAWFCGWLPSVDQEVEKLTLSPALIKRIRTLNDSITVVEKLAHQGREIANQLIEIAKKTKTGYLMSVEDRDAIENEGKKLGEVELLFTRVAQVEPELYCLLKWYQQLMHNLEGETVAAMAKETVHAFDLTIEAVELLSAYAKKTFEISKPKAVPTNVHAIRGPELKS